MLFRSGTKVSLAWGGGDPGCPSDAPGSSCCRPQEWGPLAQPWHWGPSVGSVVQVRAVLGFLSPWCCSCRRCWSSVPGAAPAGGAGPQSLVLLLLVVLVLSPWCCSCWRCWSSVPCAVPAGGVGPQSLVLLLPMVLVLSPLCCSCCWCWSSVPGAAPAGCWWLAEPHCTVV